MKYWKSRITQAFALGIVMVLCVEEMIKYDRWSLEWSGFFALVVIMGFLFGRLHWSRIRYLLVSYSYGIGENDPIVDWGVGNVTLDSNGYPPAEKIMLKIAERITGVKVLPKNIIIQNIIELSKEDYESYNSKDGS